MRNTKEIKKAIATDEFNWLGRETFIENFCEYIQKEETSTHACINGVWGSGKTTAIFGIIQKLEKINEDKNKPLVIYLDAWKYEHYEHPLFSLLKVMKETDPTIFEDIKSGFEKKNVTPQVGINLPMFNLAFSVENSSSSEKKVLNLAEYVDTLNELMIKAITRFKEERANNLIIFVDELDRAKPEFALRTLEMFHHLQDELPTHIIYSVDMNQLNGIVKHYYGYEYNVEIFTHKVFDVVIPLQKISSSNIKMYIKKIFQSSGIGFNHGDIIEYMLGYMSSDQVESLRTIKKLSENICNDLGKGYFNSDARSREYYLGGRNNEHIWGYVELLVVLNVMSLSRPILTREIVKGRSIHELADYLLVYKERDDISDLWILIRDSYNYEKEVSLIINEKDTFDTDMIIEGLKKIFIPPEGKGYARKSVFEDF